MNSKAFRRWNQDLNAYTMHYDGGLWFTYQEAEGSQWLRICLECR